MIEEFLANHKILDTVILYFIFAAIMEALPEPTENSNAIYVFLYRFLSALAGKLKNAFGRKRDAAKTPETPKVSTPNSKK